MSFLPYAVAAWLFLAGLYGIVTSRNLIHMVMCLGVLQSSTYVLFLAIGYHAGGHAPIVTTAAAITGAVDPVVQALVLTDVVIEVTVFALLLALAVEAHQRFGTLDPGRLRAVRG
jgi:multicomponent Na+:H+ antiporter subunit C